MNCLLYCFRRRTEIPADQETCAQRQDRTGRAQRQDPRQRRDNQGCIERGKRRDRHPDQSDENQATIRDNTAEKHGKPKRTDGQGRHVFLDKLFGRSRLRQDRSRRRLYMNPQAMYAQRSTCTHLLPGHQRADKEKLRTDQGRTEKSRHQKRLHQQTLIMRLKFLGNCVYIR